MKQVMIEKPKSWLDAKLENTQLRNEFMWAVIAAILTTGLILLLIGMELIFNALFFA